jgi:hypothetical protein
VIRVASSHYDTHFESFGSESLKVTAHGHAGRRSEAMREAVEWTASDVGGWWIVQIRRIGWNGG